MHKIPDPHFAGGISEAMPKILETLGERLPDDIQPMLRPQAEPLEELLLELSDPCIVKKDGTRRARATASLTYIPGEKYLVPGQIFPDDYRFHLPFSRSIVNSTE